MFLRKSLRLCRRIDSSVAHVLALSGLPVYVASSLLGSIQEQGKEGEARLSSVVA